MQLYNNPKRAMDGEAGFDIKRFIGFTLLAIVLALGANFVGISSLIMTNTNPTFFRELGLDQLYEIGGFRKYVSQDYTYQFIFPANWVVDNRILLNNARDRELPQAMQQRKKLANIGPEIAYGATSDFDENISVIRSPLQAGFTLAGTLGTPEKAAEKILTTIIAPPGSGRTYTILNSQQLDKSISPVYSFEYTLQNEEKRFFRHTISVIGNSAQRNELYTFTATIPEKLWAEEHDKLMMAAQSFEVIVP